MATPVSLRPVRPQDSAFLERVYASTRADELGATNWSDAQKTAFIRQQFTAQDQHYRAHYPTAIYSVIEHEGQPIGRLYVDRWAREIRIMDISLLPEARGRGFGSFLLHTLQAEARDAGKSLTIHVEKFNPALRLYSRLGFQPREDKGVYLLMEWRPAETA